MNCLSRFQRCFPLSETKRFGSLFLAASTLRDLILYLLNILIIKKIEGEKKPRPVSFHQSRNIPKTPETPKANLTLKPNTKRKTMKNSTKTILDKHEKAFHDTTAMIRLARLSNAIAFSMQIQSDANHIPVKGIKVLLKSC